ncbi:uncharacterized protein LOC110645158 isoform X2 [Hevea brasiliensis]|nr:uncharacterized protein LOC110645158 isoform X2 [Hevea brasiliensis]XP_058000155.1 uncharacterized protein LOC110645158 isoform X2 [Hevea brasiliensis]XP_058000158.1 uncharacterized protein LOC110645158 isoform X2 [Hevea brasiliensis]XP_058000166.1 uncharacterized protein LOC110645158 isoform X2 [Hevea brasiliensis]
MVLTLIGLRSDLSSVQNQMLTSSVIPSLEDVSARLLRISLNANGSNEIETSVLAVQIGNQHGQGGSRKGKGKGFKSHCTYCDKNGHTRDTCWALHGRPPRNNNQFNTNRHAANVAQTHGDGLLPLPKANDQQSDSIVLTGTNYNEYLQYQATKQQSSSSGTSHSGPKYEENDWNRI